MDRFENFKDRTPLADPASAGEAAVCGRQADELVPPSALTPAGTSSAAAAAPKRERRASTRAEPNEGPPDAHRSASSARRGRRTMLLPLPTGCSSGGQQSDATASAARFGDDDSAHWVNASPLGFSPVVVDHSDTATGIGGDQTALCSSATPCTDSRLVAEITQLWRMRQRWHRAEKSLILQGKAICRAWTAGDKDAADKLFARAAKGESADPTVDMALMPFLSGIARFEAERSAIEKRLRKLAQALPIWPWVAEVKGFGALNLAAIVGEAGEIASYRNPSCLWKRMGLAVIDGGRQRRVADAEAALVHGYAPQRRCVAYLLGDTLIKAGDGCRYRPVYAARRGHTAVTHPDWTKAHSHNDGARYMVKRVLRELWSEARRQQESGAPA